MSDINSKFLVDKLEEDYDSMRIEFEGKTEKDFEIIEKATLEGFIKDKKIIISSLRISFTENYSK